MKKLILIVALLTATTGRAADEIKSASPAQEDPTTKIVVDESKLSEEDRKILRRGEISQGSYIVGGILGTWPLGLGIGHAIQGRYPDMGWIFTVGELGSGLVMFSGLTCSMNIGNNSPLFDCNTDFRFTLGLMAFVGFRVWEIVDLWATPPELNRRYRQLTAGKQLSNNLTPIIAPYHDGLLIGMRYSY